MNCFYCGAALGPGTFFCPECGRRVAEDGQPASSPARRVPAVERNRQHGADADPVEPTLRLRGAASPRPFVLLSTTGQRFEVRGRSLLGRKPSPAAGIEYDAVLVVDDPGRTVSKSHAELIVSAGELLVVDLDSGNGTVVETPGAERVRCTPGMPQPVARGSRILLGRQAIDVA